MREGVRRNALGMREEEMPEAFQAVCSKLLMNGDGFVREVLN